MANARPPTKVNRNSGKGQAPAAPQVAPPFAAPPAVGPAPGVAVPRLEPTLPEGLRLGAFEIKGVISQSRAAVVYRVSDHSLGIPAAIKEYMRFSLDAKQLRASVRVVDNALDPASGITTAARFTTEASRPGAVAG